MAYGESNRHVADNVTSPITSPKGAVRQYGRLSWRQLGFLCIWWLLF